MKLSCRNLYNGYEYVCTLKQCFSLWREAKRLGGVEGETNISLDILLCSLTVYHVHVHIISKHYFNKI